MKRTSWSAGRKVLPVIAVAALCWYGGMTMARGPLSTKALVSQAISTDTRAAHSAIMALRAQGPSGLQALFAAYDSQIKQHLVSSMEDSQWKRVSYALDEVGQQKDCAASQLYWYTDLEQAKRAAQQSDKPILSLRLLGNLDDELSCANSRFFRTVLYPNTQVSEYLRSHYILHWKSERPVPTFTLDFGDGRKIVRTLTGNSIHYVLDTKGRLVDALPGLYGPQAFLRHLTDDAQIAQESATKTDDTAQRAYVQAWHKAQFDALATKWADDTRKVFGVARITNLVAFIAPVGNPRPTGSVPPGAASAGAIAVGKGVIERPVISAIAPFDAWAVGPVAFDFAWDRLGQLYAADAVLDANSRAMMVSKHPDLSRVPNMPRFAARNPFLRLAAQQTSPTPNLSPMEGLAANFERSVAQDSIRNEYVLHAKLHQWFASGEVAGDMEVLNRRVYSDLFLTPNSDPYLGLAPGGAYTALQNDGLVVEQETEGRRQEGAGTRDVSRR